MPFFADILAEVDARYPGLEEARRIHEIVRRSITRMVEDVIGEAVRRLERLAPQSAEDIRRAGEPVVTFSPTMTAREKEVKSFLFANLYRHESVLAVRREVAAVVRELFAAYMDDPGKMPEEWRRGLDDADADRRARRVCDFIAGMTDRFAIEEHARLFDHTPDLG